MKILITTLIFLIVSLSTQPQTITGLWGVNEVLVGTRVVTPVAKWLRINDDGMVQSGNGWTQNSLATWTYDESKHFFLTKNLLKAPDPFGGFYVTLTNEKMIWRRIEERDSVQVTLSRIDQLPMAPADSIQGRWTLTSTTDKSSTVSTIQQMQIRPAGLFNLTKSNGDREIGFWHMDPHESRFFLISFDKSVQDKIYRVSFDKEELTMTDVEDSSTLLFRRSLD